MREVRAEWPRWRQMSHDLPDVELADLPRWMKAAEPPQRDAVLTALFVIAATDRRAYIALAWLLMPGAAKEAGCIDRGTEPIDETLAAQLWIQLCEHDPADNSYVAAKILDRVHRESMTELGIGDLATRRDPTWARTVVVQSPREAVPDWVDEADRDSELLNDLLQRALDSGLLSERDRDLLLGLAHAAEMADAPGRRGRGGLTTPSVTQLVEETHGMSSRSIRRHVSHAVEAIREVAR